MAVTAVTATSLPKLGSPRNWEEIEASFASLQAWIGNLSDDLADLKAAIGQLNVASSHQVSMGDLPWHARRFGRLSGGLWTVEDADMHYLRYIVVGQLVMLFFRVSGTVITSASIDNLVIDLPEFIMMPERGILADGGTNPTYGAGMVDWNDNTNGTNGVGFCEASGYGAAGDLPARTQVDIVRVDPTATSVETINWPTTSDLVMRGQIAFPIKSSTIPGLGI